MTAEAKYPINFKRSGKRFMLTYNGKNSFLFVSTINIIVKTISI